MTAPDSPALPNEGLELRSLVKNTGELEVSLARVAVPRPGPGEVVVRVEATPINPSDLWLLFGPADLRTAEVARTKAGPVLTAEVPEKARKALAARVGKSMPVGNEGAGVVIAAGTDPAAQALLGRTVAMLGGAMYAQYRCLPAEQCLALPEGTPASAGASAFVNPLTALGMVETMRREGHRALVHTAAASSLGQMLQRLCAAEGVGLVNVVRKEEQVAVLRELGAAHVVSTSAPTFATDLTEAIASTGATLAFDAVGGGRLASQILTSMEEALTRNAQEYSRYGSSTHKQVYIYGMLDTGPTELTRSWGLAWGVGGWLLTPFLQKIGPAAVAQLKQRVAADIATTFATHYARTISLTDMLEPVEIDAYARRSTGGKVLVDPSRV